MPGAVLRPIPEVALPLGAVLPKVSAVELYERPVDEGATRPALLAVKDGYPEVDAGAEDLAGTGGYTTLLDCGAEVMAGVAR